MSRRSALEPALVGTALASPAFVWACLDKSVWPWDPAWFGEVSVDLWATLRLSHGLWPTAMEHAFAIKPPGLAWIGQFFVPVGRALGSVRIALLSSIVIYEAAAVALVYAAAKRLCDGDRRAALAGALTLAGAPLFVSLGHEYFAEPLQVVAVAWVLFIMASARAWAPALTLSQLTAAIALGLLAKLSTPVYVAAPAAVAVVLSAIHGRQSGRGLGWRDLHVMASAITGLGLLIGTVAWYRVNLSEAMDHAELAAADTGLYGTKRALFSEIGEWFGRLEDAAFLPYFALVVAAAAVAATVGALRARKHPHWPELLVVAACLTTVGGLLIVLSRQANEDPRFLISLVPMLALVLAAAVHASQSRAVAVTASAALAAQFALATAASFGYGPTTFSYYRLVKPQRHSLDSTLQRVVRTTCPSAANGKINVVGAEYPWLNGNTLSLIASEEFALAGRQCQYTPLGYAEQSVDAAWERVLAINPPFYVALDYGNPANRLPAELEAQTTRPDPFNRVNLGVYRRAVRSGRFVAIAESRQAGLVVLRASSGS
jgi:hypothetical protein